MASHSDFCFMYTQKIVELPSCVSFQGITQGYEEEFSSILRIME